MHSIVKEEGHIMAEELQAFWRHVSAQHRASSPAATSEKAKFSHTPGPKGSGDHDKGQAQDDEGAVWSTLRFEAQSGDNEKDPEKDQV